MNKTSLRELREIVRDEIAVTMQNGGGKSREIAQAVCAANTDLIEQLGSKLAEDSVTNMVGNEIKKWSAVGSASKRQMALPGMEMHMLRNLPAAISIPTDDSDKEDNIIFRPIAKATVYELQAHIALLTKQIDADNAKLDSLSELAKLLQSSGCDAGTTVKDALSKLEERRAA